MRPPPDYRDLAIEIDEGVVWMTINRPTKRNALNDRLRKVLIEAVDWVSNAEHAKAVVLTGRGEEAFIAGADLHESLEKSVGQLEHELAQRRIYDAIEQCQVPVIAMINGICMGAGCELALSADIRIASDNAALGLPEIKLAMIPGGGGTQRLPRLVGRGQAMAMILTGDSVTAQEAYRTGLVEILVPREELRARTYAFCQKLTVHPRAVLVRAKQAISASARLDLASGLALERRLFCEAYASEDREEGLRAFLEKRPPRYRKH